jgi:hypothetical protein
MDNFRPQDDIVLVEIDKIWRRFLWVVNKAISGGKCKVNWTK